MPKNRIKVGLVGYGKNGWTHLLLAKLHPILHNQMEIVGVFDPNPIEQEKIRKNKLIAVSSFDSLIQIPGLEGLILSSPPQFHAKQAVQSLESGIHVFSEVPMALNKEDIERVIHAEEISKRKYQFGENYIYFAEVLFASHLVESGKLGTTVYAEAEYLHDVTYRWRQNGYGDPSTPRRESWYSLFDPLMYAHSIGPAQVVLGGLSHPEVFTQVMSYGNDLGGYNNQSICAPAKSFQVALFQSENGKIAKCANAYVVAREPTRMGIQVIGNIGTYEAYNYGKPSRLFLANDHNITRQFHRQGKPHKIHRWHLQKVASHGINPMVSANARVMANWIQAIRNDKIPNLHAQIAANMCAAGIAASESLQSKKPVDIKIYSK